MKRKNVFQRIKYCHKRTIFLGIWLHVAILIHLYLKITISEVRYCAIFEEYMRYDSFIQIYERLMQ